MPESHDHNRLARIARWGRICVIGALLILVGVLSYAVISLVAQPDASWAYLGEEYEVSDVLGPRNSAKLWIIAGIHSLTDILGGVILWTALGLFALFGRGQVFTEETVSRLRRIGWCLFAMAPVSILGQTIAVAIFTFANEAGARRVSVGFSDTDAYAIVVGLIIVAASLAMAEALRLARENESFV
ncbi:DUF2975 domain-containing protein [Primorskyibacter sp. S187A]|uniref:DUF2975 domain-containing protein n=1 Tax=Primorskyibacter sp. S187A TaxID=3415130 RepID=UPI003C7A73A3